MASFSVQSLVEELHHTESLVQKRPQLAESLVANLESKLTACGHLLPGDLAALYQVLEDSQLQQNHVKALCAILDQKANGSIGGPMKTTLAPVSFDWPQNYLTKEDWEALDKANTWQAIDLLVSRYQSQCQGIHQESCHWFGGLVASPKDWQDSILHLHLPNGAAFHRCIPSEEARSQVVPYHCVSRKPQGLATKCFESHLWRQHARSKVLPGLGQFGTAPYSCQVHFQVAGWSTRHQQAKQS